MVDLANIKNRCFNSRGHVQYLDGNANVVHEQEFIKGCRRKIGKKVFIEFFDINNNFIARYDIYKLPTDKIIEMPVLDLARCNLTELPDMSMLRVFNFNCSANKIENLVGCPQTAKRIMCTYNDNLTSLRGAPANVDEFKCGYCRELENLIGGPKLAVSYEIWCNNKLASLVGAPERVFSFGLTNCNAIQNLMGGPKFARDYSVQYCENLVSLAGAPDVVEDTFFLANNPKLKNLIGGPKKVGGYVIKNNNGMTSVAGAAETVDKFVCQYNVSLVDLVGGPKSATFYDVSYNPNLVSLRGCAENVEIFIAHTCDKLETLEYAPKNAKQYRVYRNPKLKSLAHINPATQKIDYTDCPLLVGAPKQLSHHEKHEMLRQAYLDNNQEFIKQFYGHQK